MKLAQLHEARYAGAPQSSAIFIKFVGEGDRGGLPIDVVGPFISNEDAEAFIVQLRKVAPNMMKFYEQGGDVEIDSTTPPQDWMERLQEEEY